MQEQQGAPTGEAGPETGTTGAGAAGPWTTADALAAPAALATPDTTRALIRAGSSLVLCFLCVVLVMAGLAWMPTRLVVMAPGQVQDTLGSQGTHPLITISGHTTYRTTGRLDMTTVSLLGGPGATVHLYDLVKAWLDPSEVVVPSSLLFPEGQTAAQSEEEGQTEMVDSQSAAVAAALTELKIPVAIALTIDEVATSVPAKQVLREDDVLLAVAGHDATTVDGYLHLLDGVTPGATVAVKVRRDGLVRTLQVKTAKGADGQALLGVYLGLAVTPPFTVTIRLDDVGGPSAGTMFALGIYDKLTPGSLTGGAHIAGTGTMDLDGTVGAIGGIRQKLAGAREAGATWFLAPADDCSEVVGHVPSGLRVVKISTLHEAVEAVTAIGAGRGSSLATCG